MPRSRLVSSISLLLLACLPESPGAVSGGPAPADARLEIVPGADLGADAANDAIDGSPDPAPDPVIDPTSPLIVHEWGTFTSVQDTSGKSHPGLHHEDEELPAWVYRRDPGPNAYFEVLPEEPLQQLETPVVYFHAARAMDVRVGVDFPEGIISQWFPAATTFAPALFSLSAIAGGSMRWDLTVDPSIDPADFLAVDPQEIWAPSRNVRSTPVRYANPAGGVELEQFIFYRGLGQFDLPVRVTAPDDERIVVKNDSGDDLAALVLLRSTGDGGAVTVLGGLAAGTSLTALVPSAVEPWPTYVDEAHAALKQAIAATGLYDDEAEAMVDTWTRSWFGNPGLRVLYVVPRAWTDRLLPIRVTPAPKELVRTLVGRIEVLTPALQAATWEHIEALGESPTWEVLEATIDALGRFAEPRVRQALEQRGAHTGGGWLLEAAHQRP